MKNILIIATVLIALNGYSYGVKGMRRGVRKNYSSYTPTVYHSTSTTSSGHGINGCGVKYCHGNLCTSSSNSNAGNTVTDVPKQTKTLTYNEKLATVRTGLSAVRTINNTASTISRVRTANARIEIAKENLEIRKYNAGLNSKYGTKVESVPIVIKHETASIDNKSLNDNFYYTQYIDFKNSYEKEQNKNSSYAKYLYEKMMYYKEKAGK